MANETNKRNRGAIGQIALDSFSLKVIAAISMLCSHIYKCLLVSHKEFLVLDVIGRISFPIFCFVLVEGYCHTKNHKAHFTRLWIGAVISEVFFDLAFFGKIFAVEGQNVLFTMLIGVLTLKGMDECQGKLKGIPFVAGLVASWLLKVDYGCYGIWLIVVFYYLRGMKQESLLVQTASHVASVTVLGWIQFFAVGSVPFITCYNGKKGKGYKYFFYLFYPLHLLVLIMIRFLWNRL